jgi:ERCC4-type nuclease
MIFVDRREGSVDLAPLFKTKAIITTMEFGDVAFSGNNNDESISIGVERKRINDLISSISTGRLSGHQLPGMIKTYDRSYLIVEGVWKGDRRTGELLVSRDYGKSFRSLHMGMRKWSASAIYNYLTSVETFIGVPCRLTRDARDTALTIEILYGWWQNIHRHTSHIMAHKRVNHDKPTTKICSLSPDVVQNATTLKGVNKQVRMFALQLPHIDTKKSIDIAKHFKCVADMFKATGDEWLSIEGIGKATMNSIMEVLHNNK